MSIVVYGTDPTGELTELTVEKGTKEEVQESLIKQGWSILSISDFMEKEK